MVTHVWTEPKKIYIFLEATLTYIKIPRDSVGHFLNKNLTS